MFRITFFIFLLAGCSSVAPHPDVLDTLGNGRLITQHKIVKAERWVLAPLSAVRVETPTALTRLDGVAAASRGLSEQLRVVDNAPWLLRVYWPGDEAGAQPRLKLSLLALDDLIDPAADTALIVVDVFDATGTHWVQRLAVDVSPWWFGHDWHDPEQLEAVFQAVGRTLVGTPS